MGASLSASLRPLAVIIPFRFAAAVAVAAHGRRRSRGNFNTLAAAAPRRMARVELGQSTLICVPRFSEATLQTCSETTKVVLQLTDNGSTESAGLRHRGSENRNSQDIGLNLQQ